MRYSAHENQSAIRNQKLSQHKEVALLPSLRLVRKRARLSVLVRLAQKRVLVLNYLSKDELLNLLRVAREASLRDFLLILLAYRHGLRAGEVTSLKTSDIVNGSLDIRRLKGSRHTVQPIESHKGVPLLNEERGLGEWLRTERPRNSGDALFPSITRGGCLTAKSFNAIFHKYARLAGLPPEKSHPHILKHSLCTHLVRAGVDIAMVQTRVGHANIASTMKYTHLNQAEVAEKTHNTLLEVFK